MIGQNANIKPPVNEAALANAGRGTFDFGSAHLIGIGGCGMSAIAWALMACGVRVSGSDASCNNNCRQLGESGATIFTGHAASQIGTAEVVIVSTAIRENNAELQAARERGIRILHRSDALALFLAQRRSILISGTHGKTTTTALMGLVLEAAGFDPWVFVGGRVPAFNGNTRVGGLEWAAAEADESDGSFETLPANHLIVTNIEDDHLDYWKSSAQMMQGYRRVVDKTARNGIVLCSLDDAGTTELREIVSRPLLTYSVWSELGHYSAGNILLNAYSSAFDLFIGRRRARRYELGVPGIHNISNAVAVLGLAHELGADLDLVGDALASFHGVGRRFDVKGHLHNITVIDDYAHHPTEIAATIAAARALKQQSGGRIVVVFQPHRYTRTRDLIEEFIASFDEADALVLTDIYSAGEEPIDGVTIEALARGVANRGAVDPKLIRNREEIADRLALELRPGDVVLTLGAGDNTKTGDEILRALAHYFPVNGDPTCS